MSFKYFLELYDSWNEIVVVNDNYLQCIAQDKGFFIYENHPELYEMRVVCFGFYDGKLCVRVA